MKPEQPKVYEVICYACGVCGVVYASRIDAERCCTP